MNTKLFPFMFLLIAFLFSCAEKERAESTTEEEIVKNLLPAILINEEDTTFRIEERMDKYKVPAVSIAVIDGNRIIYSAAYGVKRFGDSAKVDERTLFQAASVSKPVAAVGAVKLAQDGYFSLDKDIDSLVEGLGIDRSEFTGKINLKSILSHSAGFGVGGFTGYFSDTSLPTVDQIISGSPVSNSPPVKLINEPGTKFSYSGGGYMIMQKVIESIINKPFDKIMKEKVFDPLNMNHTCYAPLSEEQKRTAAFGHGSGTDHLPDYAPIHVESAAGGLWTTPSDLSKLLIELMLAYQGRSNDLLSKDTVQLMLEPRYWNYSMGFKVNGKGKDLRFSHGGATIGWYCQFIAFPKRGEAVVVMTNGEQGWVLYPEIERAVSKLLDWPILKPDRIRTFPISDDDLTNYSGKYTGDAFDPVIEINKEHLELNYGNISWQLYPVSKDTFRIREITGEAIFYFDEKGKVEDMHLWIGQPDWSPYRSWDFRKENPGPKEN